MRTALSVNKITGYVGQALNTVRNKCLEAVSKLIF